MQLDDIEPDLFGYVRDLAGIVCPKDANALDASAFTGGVENRGRLFRRDATRAISEDDAYVTGTNFRRQRSVLGSRHTAELNFCEHFPSARFQ
jgi:hypothetical protein